MLLLREKITGWDTFVDEQTSGVFPYFYNATILGGWVDITNIDNNHLYGFRAADNLRATEEITTLFEAKTGNTEEEKWDNCTQSEKLAIAFRQIVSKPLRLQVFTPLQDRQNFDNTLMLNSQNRLSRVMASKSAMGYELTTEDGQDLFTDVCLKIMSYEATGNDDLKNWMMSLPPYEIDGFKSKTYWTQQLEDIFVEIVVNGIY
jgi:hypothetical protein